SQDSAEREKRLRAATDAIRQHRREVLQSGLIPISTVRENTELLRACHEIIAAYRRGTDFDIRMHPADSLIMAGDPTTQLTWMEAKRDGIAFTPRNGKPGEVNGRGFTARRS